MTAQNRLVQLQNSCHCIKFMTVSTNIQLQSFSFCGTSFLRAIAECFARLSHGLTVRPSVRTYVTLCDCIKTVQARITKSLLWAAPKTLVSCDKISCPYARGFPFNEGVKEGYPLKTSFLPYWLVYCEKGCR